ncbi:LysR family transcriptional regulator [Glutamicibacter protophormiae]|uniref:LysR family transcriptional regulator n=1 Tax=Glutamicibacter protophormiae TaxID=37930 RepID=UPI0033349AD0
MDLVEGCKIFISVAEGGSVTDGASIAGIAQPVASRRLTALEAELGGKLFDRHGRGVSLTPFGNELLAPARRLVRLAEEMLIDASRALLSPVTLGLPASCFPLDLARLAAKSISSGINVEPVLLSPERRAGALSERQIRAAVLAVPASEARWQVPLGVAGKHVANRIPASGLRMSDLRGSRSNSGLASYSGSRVLVLPEDDVPHVRGILLRAGDRGGVLPNQISIANSDAVAAALAMTENHLLLCGKSEAKKFELDWAPLRDPELIRGYKIAATSGADVEIFHELTDEIANCLGYEND